MKELGRKAWSYIVFEEEGKVFIKVVCGTVGLYEVDVELSEEERSRFQNHPMFAEDMAERIRSNPTRYRKR